MDARQDTTGAVGSLALTLGLAIGVGVAGLVIGGLLGGRLGSAVELFIGTLSTGILTSGLSDTFMPIRMSPEMFALRRWLWLSVAAGFAAIEYLTQADDFGPGQLIACVVIGLAIATITVWWLVVARRQHFGVGSAVRSRS